MKRGLGCLLFAAAAFAAQERPSPADITAGAKTFRSHCSPCHGMNGAGGRGPNLANGMFYRGSTDAAILANISNGIPGTEMPGLFYSEDRVRQVVAYIRSLNAESSGEPGGDAVHGGALFQRSGCPHCHRVSGQGDRMGPDLTTIGQSRSKEHLRQAVVDPEADVRQRYWVVRAKDAAGKPVEGFLMNEDTYTVQLIDMKSDLRSLAKAELQDYRVEKISKMPSYKGKIEGDDLRDLVAYLSSLRPNGETR